MPFTDHIPPKLPGLGKFYMAGQWLFPGGGLPPAGQSGKWAIQYICREEKKKFNSHPSVKTNSND